MRYALRYSEKEKAICLKSEIVNSEAFRAHRLLISNKLLTMNYELLQVVANKNTPLIQQQPL